MTNTQTLDQLLVFHMGNDDVIHDLMTKATQAKTEREFNRVYDELELRKEQIRQALLEERELN